MAIKNNNDMKEGTAANEMKSERWAHRAHAEELGHVWAALTGMNPEILIPQVVATVLHDGGSRPPWQWKGKGKEYILMAWPQDQPIRAAVLMCGDEGQKLEPLTVVPLLEGFPNDLTVEEIHARSSGGLGDVGVEMVGGKNPMWFLDPLFGRDLADLTPGVTHTFWFAAAALMARKALLDEISLTSGPQYEAWAEKWLGTHKGANSWEAPPLKIDIRGKPMIMPGRVFGEYQIRAKIEKVEDCHLEKMPIKALFLNFPFNERPSLRLPLYASKVALGEYEPKAGDEIEAYAWFQGRIIDLEQGTGMQPDEQA